MKKGIASLIIFVLTSTSVFAYYGVRPMAMGGAFTAVADDANAAYYNPAGFAINPGMDLKGTALIDNRNQSIGDNYLALKMCFETKMRSPFEWIAGVGVLSALGLTGAKYLADQGILKKNWGRTGEKHEKEESMAEEVKKEGEEEKISRKEMVKKAIKKVLTPEEEKKVIVEKHVYHHGPRYYGPVPVYNPYYDSDYGRPTYYEDREYAPEEEVAPTNKAQFAAGITWMHDKNNLPTVDQNTNWYTLSLATAWEETVALGTNLNVYDLTIPSNNIRGLGAGFDFGVLIRSYERLFLGLSAQEVLTTDIHWTNGATTRYMMQVNAGVAVRPLREIIISADMRNIFAQNNLPATAHYGVELRPVPGIALRGGLYDNNKTAGIGVAIGEMMVDYAILGGSFSRSQMASLTWRF